MNAAQDLNALVKNIVEASVVQDATTTQAAQSLPQPLEDIVLAYVGGGTGGNNIL